MAAIADPHIAAKAAPTINTLVFRQLLGFLLHKHPDRTQRYSLSFGAAHIFYTRSGRSALHRLSAGGC